MENSRLKDKLPKNHFQKALDFVKKHARYFTAGTLFVVLVLVLVQCADPGQGAGGVSPTEIGQEQEEAYQIDAYENVNALIAQYYAAYAAGDTATIAAIATPVSANEQSYIALFSQYVDEYQNVKCYTKTGLDANSYLVSVSMEIKFSGVDTTAPGLDFFYLRTNDQGSLYIDNLYSQYNLTNQENALDTSVQNLIDKFENDKDVVALRSEVQGKYNAALTADANLDNLLKSTIPDAIEQWVVAVTQQNAQAAGTDVAAETPETPPEGGEAAAETPNAGGETPPVEDTQPQAPQTTETLATKERVNVRVAADTAADKLTTLDAGTVVTRTAVQGDWSVIDYNGTPGYIKNEFLTYDLPQTGTGNAGTAGGDAALSEGAEITLAQTVNIRSSMSETSDRVGTAYTGEKVTVVMTYAEGWTKVTWNGKTGYIKSSLLQ